MITKTKKAIFHNNELIQPEAWEMQGVSAKHESGAAIGKFGTGLCYAIAVLLRTNHKVSIKAGATLYEFGLIDMNFRGKEFQRITCNDVPLSFTTHYGHTWKVWEAYRELASNCMDEGGIQFSGEAMDEGTSVIIEGDEMLACMDDHDKYFIGDRVPIESAATVDVHEGHGVIYYKGVRVGEIGGGAALYSYHIKKTIDLTEDRTFKYEFEVRNAISLAVTSELKDKDLIKSVIRDGKSWEAETLNFDQQWGDRFKSVISEAWANDPTSLGERVQSLVPTKIQGATFLDMEPTEEETLMIDRAKSFLSDAGYPVGAIIKIVNSKDPHLYGFEHKGTIHLTKKAFDEGVFGLVTTIFEENCHTNGHSDFSRSFQTHLIKEVIKQAAGKLKTAL